MERREFLKKAGLGSVAFASFPFLAEVASAAEAVDDGRTKFYFMAVSGLAPTLTGGETIVMSGSGHFGGARVEGGGEFVRFDGTQIPSPVSWARDAGEPHV